MQGGVERPILREGALQKLSKALVLSPRTQRLLERFYVFLFAVVLDGPFFEDRREPAKEARTNGRLGASLERTSARTNFRNPMLENIVEDITRLNLDAIELR